MRSARPENAHIFAPASGAKAFDYVYLTDGFNTWYLPVETREERISARWYLRHVGHEHVTIRRGVPEWADSQSCPTVGELFAHVREDENDKSWFNPPFFEGAGE